MTKKRKTTEPLPRSGLIEWVDRPPPRPAQTVKELKKGFRDFAHSLSLEQRLKTCRRNLGDAEKLALSIYAKHGLPAVNGCYGRREGGEWEAISLATEPGGKWEPVKEFIDDPTCDRFHLFKVPEIDFPLEHEVRRAGELLSLTDDAFRLLDQAESTGSSEAVAALMMGLRLMNCVYVWREEWVLNEYIVPATRLKHAGVEGGAKSVNTRRRKASEWQAHALTLASSIREVGHSLSQRDLASDIRAGWKLEVPAAPSFDSILAFVRKAEKDGLLKARKVS
jgi:hypothetical protein